MRQSTHSPQMTSTFRTRGHSSAELATDNRKTRAQVARLARVKATAERQNAVSAELLQAVHARDTFIAIAAHELRNAMTPIHGHVEYMLTIGRQRDDRGYPKAVIIALERLAGLIGEYIRRATTLLDISRITAGKLRAELSVVDFSGIIRQVVHRHQVAAQRSRCRLETNIEPNVSGLLDDLAVQQIADNLLSNAIKYGAGGPIEVSLVRHSTTARLIVRDHGIGISENDQARIFDAFERAVTQREHSGFGVGLWVTRQLVDAMSGEIHVTSRPAQGATFTVTLPLSPT